MYYPYDDTALCLIDKQIHPCGIINAFAWHVCYQANVYEKAKG